MAPRARAITRLRMLTWLTIAWNVVEAGVALVSGSVAGSVSLLAFGGDSVIEVSSAAVLAWRLGRERRDGCRQVDDRVATRLVAASLTALGLIAAVTAIAHLVSAARPAASPVGIALAALSLVVMPVLARAKRRLAPVVGSRAVQADATQTDLCAWMSAALLLGLVVNGAWGWWWADPVAGVVIASLALHEARVTWQADALEDTCCA